MHSSCCSATQRGRRARFRAAAAQCWNSARVLLQRCQNEGCNELTNAVQSCERPPAAAQGRHHAGAGGTWCRWNAWCLTGPGTAQWKAVEGGMEDGAGAGGGRTCCDLALDDGQTCSDLARAAGRRRRWTRRHRNDKSKSATGHKGCSASSHLELCSASQRRRQPWAVCVSKQQRAQVVEVGTIGQIAAGRAA